MALKTTPIAPQAHVPISFLIAMALVALFLFGWLSSLPLWLVIVLAVFVFRDPYRKVPAAPLGIVAPLDGVVSEVEPCTDTWLERQALRVTIQVPLSGPYMIRSPTEGKVMRYWVNGERNTFGQWIQTDEQDDVLLLIQPRFVVGTLRFKVAAGERIGQGASCGLSHFASLVELYLPANSVINVKKGDKVSAGEDILATLVH